MRLAIAVGLGAAAASVVVAALLFFYPPTTTVSGDNVPIAETGGLEGYDQTVIYIGDVRLLADIADTPEKRTKGLAVRDSMEEGEAMLFLFDAEGRHSFWMNNMKFPIDIIWLDSDKTVVHIEPSLEPCAPFDCPSYVPDRSALYVLETVAGFSEKHGVVEGTKAEFKLG